MKLVMIEADGEVCPGRIAGDRIVELSGLGTDLRSILESGHLDRARSSEGRSIPLGSVKLLAPIWNPAIVLSVGMNYHQHLKEMKTPAPAKPAAFTKSVASIIGPDTPIRIPHSHPNMVDWEGEFSVVIGAPCHRVTAARALDYLSSYTIVNDVSLAIGSRPPSPRRVMGSIHAWEENLLGKMFPTFCPMGPVLATKEDVLDPSNVHIDTRLNDKIMQSANTSDLVFGVRELIEYCSQFYLLKPGDVITSGSPSGVVLWS